MKKLYDVPEAGEYSRGAFGAKGERVAKESKRLASGPAKNASEEKFEYVPSKTNGRPSMPPEGPKAGTRSVESAGAGSKPSGSPGGKGSSREYPVPKRKPLSEYKSESSDGRDYAKMRDKAVVDASDRFNSSDHG